MARYDRIIAMKDVPFARIVWDYQEQFPGRDIYVPVKTYIDLLKRLELGYDLTYGRIVNRRTETRIYMSYRAPHYCL